MSAAAWNNRGPVQACDITVYWRFRAEVVLFLPACLGLLCRTTICHEFTISKSRKVTELCALQRDAEVAVSVGKFGTSSLNAR
nr:hypothetical protein CFP56_54965 [Quercus suber]POF24043.1 hypothetical protein CFP56_54979 [Quercus suber]